MSSASQGWDFTAVLDLMKRLSTQDALNIVKPVKEEPLPDLTQTDSSTSSEVENTLSEVDNSLPSLGNFESVWTNLSPNDKPKSVTATLPIQIPSIRIGKGDVSDDNLVDDELDFDLANSFAERNLEEPAFTPSKSTAKRNRRKAAAALKLADETTQKLSTPAPKTAVSTSLPTPKTHIEPVKVQTPTKAVKTPQAHAEKVAQKERRTSSEAIQKFDDPKKSKKTREVVSDNETRKFDQLSKDRTKIIQELTNSASPITKKTNLPSAIRYETPALTPSNIVTPTKSIKDVRFAEPATPLKQLSPSALNTPVPSTPNDPTYTFSARKAHLTALLYATFRDEWASLENLGDIRALPSQQALDPSGIHVFIDISNILIGFHETIKESQGLAKHSRMTRQKLAFHNFSLILERGRPVAKRVLAGSDRWESILEAAEIGYQTLILERVEKIKEPTDRQKRLAAKRSSYSPYNGTGFTDSSDGEHRALALRPRRVEQGVDEMLHLHMLETIVDAETPSTIVLATGDAAEAEYSAGFMAMVERALNKGWKVEVVAWRAGLSWRYRDPEFQGKWEGRFRVVELDGFVGALKGDYV